MIRDLGGEFFSTTAWHPDADGQSERTSQTVEIALRSFITEYPDADRTDTTPHILNSSQNASTGVTPFEYLYGFNPHNGFDILTSQDIMIPEEYTAARIHFREMGEQSIAFARMKQKFHFDKRHQSLRLKPGDQALLHLHHGYKLTGHLNRKLDRQREGPLHIVETVGKNAYRIEVTPGMKIHDVITAHQLEPMPSGTDPWGRDFPNPQPIRQEDEDREFYPIDYIIKRRINTH
ncbi:Retrovirus-related Pol polyprotein from transposon gypsy [Curvularia clavata]|uniref:Retrovirus-related Pol polyprotein from transposon gypsy n=1 Tax=Curvularia clavata TaxID=95742 RepID=A0A9Q9DSS9_CURCL|nr:Retrovirus-related Pol polyprotein from transposon gypsy [Curvularia clavata]